MSPKKRKPVSVESEGWAIEGEFGESDSENEELELMKNRCIEDVKVIIIADCPPNCDNTLALNKELQRRLLFVTQKLTELLQKIQDRYDKNEAELKLLITPNKRPATKSGAIWKGRTFLFAGSMFFRDASRRGCPNNLDYEERKLDGEIFPSDIDLIPRHVWSALDKVKVLQGVKEQVLAYLKDWQKHNAFRFKPSTAENVELHTAKLAKLLKKVDSRFRIDWNEISAHNLECRHPPSACEAMWKMYLQPNLNRAGWTEEENERLREAALKYDCQNWQAIAAYVGRRSEFQCFLQHQTKIIYRLPNHLTRWNEEDDRRLLKAVKQYTVNGVVQWSLVAAQFPHRQPDTIKWRYTYRLNPTISHAAFTAKEDILLLAALQHYNQFANLPRTLFPNRTLTQLRSRFNNTLVDRHKRAPWSIEDDKKLLHFVAKHGRSQWHKCAQTLGNHSRISCRTRFLVIEKNVRKNPHITVDDIPRVGQLKMSTVVTTQNWADKVSEISKNPNLSLKPKAKKSKSSKRKKIKCSRAVKDTQTWIKTEIAPGSALFETETNFVESDAASENPIQLEGTPSTAAMPFAKADNISFVPVKDKPNLCHSKQKRSRRKPLYKQRLRKLGLSLYSSFKFTYNFKCGGPTLNEPVPASQSLPPAMKCYGIRTKAQIKSHRSYDAVIKNMAKIVSGRQSFGRRANVSYLPPCASSLIAARNIEILLAQHPELTSPAIPQNEHVEKFNKMMNAFLLSTCMLLEVEVPTNDTDLDIVAILGSDEPEHQTAQQSAVKTYLDLAARPLEICDPPPSTTKRRVLQEEIVKEPQKRKRKKIAKQSN